MTDRAYTIVQVRTKDGKSYTVGQMATAFVEDTCGGEPCPIEIIVRMDDCMTIHCACRESLLAIPMENVSDFRSALVEVERPPTIHQATASDVAALGKMASQ